MKTTLRGLAKSGIHLGRQSKRLAYLMDDVAIEALIQEGHARKSHARWTKMDQVYTALRRELYRTPAWRYGPQRILTVSREALDSLRPFTTFRGKRFCDLGCGRYHHSEYQR